MMRSSFGIAAESTLSVVVLPEPVPPEMRTLSLPRTQASRNWAALRRERAEAEQVLHRERVLAELADRQRRGPCTASGGMMAFTREPSGRRASTIGEASSMRRPMRRDDLVDDAQQVLVVDERGVRCAVSLPRRSM